MQVTGRRKNSLKILILLAVVCSFSLIALTAIELLTDRPAENKPPGQTASSGPLNTGDIQGNNGQPHGAGSEELPPDTGTDGTATGSPRPPRDMPPNNTDASITTTTGDLVPPGTGVPEPLDRPPDPAIKPELVRTYIEKFVREHTMSNQLEIPELNGNYFPPNTQLLAVHVHGVSVTMDFSAEILAHVHQPEIFDQWQRKLITGIYEVAPALVNFHVRVRDEKGNLRLLNDFLKIPPEKKPRDEQP